MRDILYNSLAIIGQARTQKNICNLNIIAWALGQLKINFKSIFKIFTKLLKPGARQ